MCFSVLSNNKQGEQMYEKNTRAFNTTLDTGLYTRYDTQTKSLWYESGDMRQSFSYQFFISCIRKDKANNETPVVTLDEVIKKT